MNTTDDDTLHPSEPRPLGFWLRAVDGLLTRRFAGALQNEALDRRDWMLLNAVAGDAPAPWLADRLARGGKRVRALADRGWLAREEDGRWTLTDEGRAAKARIASAVDGIRAEVAGAVTPDAFATTVASLEAIARELGWDESEPGDGFGRRHGHGFGPGFGHRHGFGPGRGFGPGFGPGFGHGRGFGPGRGFDPGFGPGFAPGRGFGPGRGHGRGFGPDTEHCGAHGDRHGNAHGHHRGDRAYDRGFDACFARGREAAASGTAS
jgi:hypothetical protein